MDPIHVVGEGRRRREGCAYFKRVVLVVVASLAFIAGSLVVALESERPHGHAPTVPELDAVAHAA